MRSAICYNRNGFSLVEAIVAGTISILVILAGIALFLMNADQIRGSFISCMTRMQYQTVIEQIEAHARQAKMILSSNDINFFESDTLPDTSDVIYFIGTTGTTLGAYRRSGSLLEEFKGTFIPFRAGNDTVRVCGLDKAFTIAGDRKNVRLNLNVFGIDGAQSDTVFSKGESFTCRN